MIFNKHFNLVGQHAFLGASKYHWINYDEEKLISVYQNYLAIERGTELHDFAKRCIELGIKLPRSKKTLNSFVNDAIGYSMTPEQVLYYSDNCFGTADAISFKDNLLRVHDLKTGATPVSMNQLKIYAALFCLEYEQKPEQIAMELRVYQNDDVTVESADAEEIRGIMNKIILFDKRLRKYQEKGI